ncbi:MAG TPA: HK97 family phage prohead protease [Jiangellaceae bacterium]|nr:HK97 family phage prohead protease [Jiangellaceae bacterium]
MTAAAINDLPDSAFAYIEPGGEKDEDGKTVPRSKRHFPIHDAAHVRNALARAPQSPYGDKAMGKIKAAARKFGIEVSDDAQRSDRAVFDRSWALEDIHILRSADGHSDGRTVEAYAAIFNSPAEIRDQYGHYMEEIERSAFNRTLSHGIDRVGVYYHHGMTLHGTPSDLGSVPIGRPIDVRSDQRGLLTVTRYNKSQLADSVLEAIRNGDIRGYSFRGPIIRSSPKRPPRARPGAPLPMWRHAELGLREYGPTPTPAYADAGILAMRSTLNEIREELFSLSRNITSSTPMDPDDVAATPDPGPGAEDSLTQHSGRQQRIARLRAQAHFLGVTK